MKTPGVTLILLVSLSVILIMVLAALGAGSHQLAPAGTANQTLPDLSVYITLTKAAEANQNWTQCFSISSEGLARYPDNATRPRGDGKIQRGTCCR